MTLFPFWRKRAALVWTDNPYLIPDTQVRGFMLVAIGAWMSRASYETQHAATLENIASRMAWDKRIEAPDPDRAVPVIGPKPLMHNQINGITA